MKSNPYRVRICNGKTGHFYEAVGYYDPQQNLRFITEGYHCSACGRDFDLNKKEIKKGGNHEKLS